MRRCTPVILTQEAAQGEQHELKANLVARHGGALLNASTQKARQVGLCEFETTLVYRVSSRPALVTQRVLVSKTNKGK